MSSERAGTPTHGRLDREKAREVLDRVDYHVSDDWSEVLDALEACVVPDPRITALTADERAAIAALIENEMGEGTSKFGKAGHGLVRLGALLDKFDDDQEEAEIPYPEGAPDPNWWDDRIDPQ